jgi:hypothetical protein
LQNFNRYSNSLEPGNLAAFVLRQFSNVTLEQYIPMGEVFQASDADGRTSLGFFRLGMLLSWS